MNARLYLDVCCLNRPFDDQSQIRIRLESEAVLFILSRVGDGDWSWSGSEVMDLEVERTPDPDRRRRIQLLMGLAERKIVLEDARTKRAVELEALGFHAFDALHLACAEAGSIDVFLTTDDRLLRKAVRLGSGLRIRVVNPLQWVQEVTAQ
jgi:hypothetical protein